MDIVKFLRREKEILTTKMEVMQTESARIKSQLDFAQKELAESRYCKIRFTEFICLIIIYKVHKDLVIRPKLPDKEYGSS